ncbi:hypothetical protein [Streptomyces sp. NPDC005989]|uniref:hypothetical protein n=1 Tax=Streptomyces sp. NPDC005989 TaxID=3156727 RepID=UPI0033ECBB4A
MKWKDGGKRSDGWQTERFDDEDSAKVFKDAVDAAGQHWPPGWVKGKGYIDPTAADELRYCFDRWAVESVENRTAGKRYKQQRIRAMEMYMFPTFGNCDIRSAEHFSKATIGAWVNKMLKMKVKRGSKIKDMSPETLRGLHGLLPSVLKEAVVAEPPLRDRNPCDLTRLPSNDNWGIGDDESSDEMGRGEAAASRRFGAWVASRSATLMNEGPGGRTGLWLANAITSSICPSAISCRSGPSVGELTPR